MTVSRSLAWVLLLMTLVGSSLIRQLHEFIPEWTPLPWPIRSPLYAFLVILFLMVALGTSRRSSPGSDAAGGRVRIAMLSPLLLAMVYEKVLSITLYEALLDHTVRIPWMRDHLDAWIHVVIGAGMILAVLLLVPLMRGVSLSDFTQPARLRSGVYLQMIALIVTYGLLSGLANLVSWHNGQYTLRPGDRATQLAGLAFDASLWECWPVLTSGATLFVVDGQTRLSPEALIGFFVDHEITVAFVPTPLAELLLPLEWPADTRLRELLTGGSQLHRLRDDLVTGRNEHPRGVCRNGDDER